MLEYPQAVRDEDLSVLRRIHPGQRQGLPSLWPRPQMDAFEFAWCYHFRAGIRIVILVLGC
jgi:hypothetical protein